MRGSFLSSTHPCPILLLNLLMLSTHVLLAQRTSSLEQSPVQLPDAPHVHLTNARLSFSLRQNEGYTKSWMKLLPDHRSYDRLPININEVLGQDIRKGEFWSKSMYFLGSAPPKWITFAPAYGHVHHETIHGASDLEHHGHNIPWASSIALRIAKRAKAHPHITSVLKMVQPQF